MKIYVVNDATQVDVTEAVQVIFDGLMGSMDAGSGFLDREEEEALRHLAKVAGFEEPHFTSDPCKECEHGYAMHGVAYGCCVREESEPAVYERVRSVRMVPQTLSKEQYANIYDALQGADDPEAVQGILSHARSVQTKYHLVEQEYWRTKTVKDAVYETCSCEKFV